MSESIVSYVSLPEFSIWDKVKKERILTSFDLEVTARCNFNCRHCCINLPAGDKKAQERELSFKEITKIADEAVSLGSLWCLITGGEPLLREDFFDIYLYLKRKGLLVSIFTNAAILTEEHIKVFNKYPPRDIEVTVYGVTKETFERVTRRPGSFKAFLRGLNLLLESGIKVRLKAMALRSNIHEFPEIVHFCREKTKDYFRFDPFLTLRADRNQKRNREIKSERLTPDEIVALEQSDPERFTSLEKGCEQLVVPEFADSTCSHLFNCGAGNGSFTVSYDGLFRLCSSLCHPDCVYDIKRGNLADAWNNFVPEILKMQSEKKAFYNKCRICPIINLCMWCPAHAHLESGELDEWIEYFCEVAHARAKSLGKGGRGVRETPNYSPLKGVDRKT
ncbi:MAG: radical SAM protein [Candidatus Aminicenantaceae bacterium]